jgi:hypothetical protein
MRNLAEIFHPRRACLGFHTTKTPKTLKKTPQILNAMNGFPRTA